MLVPSYLAGVSGVLIYIGIVDPAVQSWVFGGAAFFALSAISETIVRVGNRIIQVLKEVNA